jgi:hypothetical protein
MMRLVAFARVALLAVIGLTWMTVPVSAGSPVDPDSLIPVPPPGADCRADGNRIICHTSVIEPDAVNEPILELACGTIYETSHDVRRGIRWYDATSRTIQKRYVAFELAGTWSLSPNGSGPTATVTVQAISRDVVFPDPYDPDTWPTTFYGVGFSVRAPGFGVIAHVRHEDGYGPDEESHGVADALGDQEVSSELCAALGS